MIKKITNVLIILAVIGVLVSPIFIHVKVECKSQSGSCPPEINSKLANLKSKNLFQARKESIKIMKNSFLVSTYSIQFKLPDILLINTIIKKPVFSVFDKASGKYFLLDDKGTILSITDKTNLPTIIKDSTNNALGQVVSSEDLFSLKIVQGVNQMYQVSTGIVQNDSLVVDLAQGIRVIFPMKDFEIDVLLGSLRLIYNKITTDYPGVYSQIDMRYKNPILR